MRRLLPIVALVAVATELFVPATAAGAWSRPPIRIAGASRYETAVRISSATFPEGAAAVVIASGESFPDGLAAGPLAAIEGGPVLLAAHDTLPQITRDELVRLHPEKVFVVGGTSALSDDVLAAIGAATTVQPHRIAGATRYETSTAVSSLFPSPAPVAFVASGADFPDALAGGAAAAAASAPLLLTPTGVLPAAVGDELARLAPPDTLVLGGTGAVSAAVEQAVDARVDHVRRLAGADRYGTAAAIATDRFGAATQVVLATGGAFPDALAAAPYARWQQAPVLLTGGCLPPVTLGFLRGHGWADVTVVGGTSAVPELGMSMPCAPVPDGELAPGLTLDTHLLPGPNVSHIVGVTRAAGWSLRATTASGNLFSRLWPTDIDRRLGARVAVNGTFFTAATGDPSYALAVDGRLLKAPGGGGTVLGLDPTNPRASLFATPQFDIQIDGNRVDRVNAGAPGDGEIGMFTREYNRTVDVGASYCRAALSPVGGAVPAADGSVQQDYDVAASSCSTDPIPDTDADVVAALEGTTGGDIVSALTGRVTYTWRVHPAANGVSVVLGGNVTLVHGGAVSTDITMNSGPFYDVRAARTAVCALRDQTMLLVTIDGGQPGYSTGMTPRELADYLVSLGCFDALNLDGGGSTALVVDGVLANRPSDHAGQRAVSTSLFVAPSTPAP
jgi:putative cell wall-binding protein